MTTRTTIQAPTIRRLAKHLRSLALAVMAMALALLLPATASAVAAAPSNAGAEVANLVPNPSAETGQAGSPTSWSPGKWGTNTTSFTHTTDAHSGSYALNIKMVTRTSGDAKWYFAPVTVAPTTSYTVTNWFKSTVKTTIAAAITTTSGATSYVSLGTPAMSATWKQNAHTFTTPANALRVTIYHFIENAGELTVDDYSLTTTEASPAPTPDPVPPVNLISNPSLETSANVSTPTNWYTNKWGTNTTAFKHATTGYTGSRSVEVSTTSYTNGGSHWLYNSVPVTPGRIYQHSNWYKSSVKTSVYARVTMNDGSVKEIWQGDAPASAQWTQWRTRIVAASNATRLSVFQTLRAVGTLATDDYLLGAVSPVPYDRALVSVTFDDGWSDQYTAARPVLNALGFDATYYTISDRLNLRYYMKGAQVQSLHSEGNEIASHSINHSDFTTLTAAQVTDQFATSQSTFQTLIGAPVTSFAYPYGHYTTSTLDSGKAYYKSQRSIDPGMNFKDEMDVTRLKSVVITNTTTTAEVQSLIDSASTAKSWLILCYHEIATIPVPGGDAAGTVTPASFKSHMDYLKDKGVAVQTVKAALAEVQAQ